MTVKKLFNKFNDVSAELITAIICNMWFFWFSLIVILVIRLSHTYLAPQLNDIESDIQLLLLAANAVVGGKQLTVLIRLLKHLDKNIDNIDLELDEVRNGIDELK
jgi:hypothetical protein